MAVSYYNIKLLFLLSLVLNFYSHLNLGIYPLLITLQSELWKSHCKITT